MDEDGELFTCGSVNTKTTRRGPPQCGLHTLCCFHTTCACFKVAFTKTGLHLPFFVCAERELTKRGVVLLFSNTVTVEMLESHSRVTQVIGRKSHK